jgi:DNA-binding transcriptional MerR regulator
MFDRKKYMKEYRRKWYLKNKERLNKKSAKYEKDNREKVNMTHKKYVESHKEQRKNTCRKYYDSHLEKIRNDKYLKRYGINIEEFDRMIESQNGKCAICGKHYSELEKSLCVDHDHNTGKVRGLLCHTCNMILGNTHDSIFVLKKAIEYLQANLLE